MGASGGYKGPLEKVAPCQWRIPKSYRPDMRVDGIIFADDTLIEQIRKDQGPEQVANVATLPGIQSASLAMPDIHWGYGFCIGGVAATDPEEGGVISPGGVGYDINCGVRLLRTDLHWSEAKDRIKPLVDQLFRDIPTGVGQSGRYLFDKPKLTRLMETGSAYVVGQGWGTERDLEYTEAGGRLDGADPSRVSDRAIQRGYDQCGTLGSGNHFLEVQVVDRIHDPAAAEVMGLHEGPDHRADPLRLAGAGLPGLRRLPRHVQERAQAIRVRAAGLAARLRPGAEPGRPVLPGRHARRGQLRLVQPPAPDAPGARGVRPGLRQALGRPGHGPDLRRGAQHRQVRGAHGRPRRVEAGLRPSQGGDAGVPGRAIRRSPRPTRRSASRSSSPAAWGRRAGSWSGSRGAWSTRSARPATAPAG